ncbi:MAG TPA: sodium:glutamate symporter [Candidatus Aminicenantes bacterium]|nr:sodium:glutamate symporter [Candidatus Aminicenantes bacterium]
MDIVTSFCGLSLLLVVGKILRIRIPLLQRLYIPTSVIGGTLGLIILQTTGDAIPAGWTRGWSELPGFLINIVFAALFLGVTIPPLKEIWRRSAPQLAYGQVVAWGQYFVGMGLVLFFLGPLFGLPDVFGVIVEVGFEGGHGTAAGLRDTFATFRWPEGSDYALAAATVGVVSAIVGGIILINWAARRGHTHRLRPLDQLGTGEWGGFYSPDRRPVAGRQTVPADSIDSLAFHLAVIGIAVLIGFGIKQALVQIEHLWPSLQRSHALSGFPLFPLCMLGGLIIQVFLDRFRKIPFVPLDHALMQRLSGTALDFLVVSAISTIRLEIITARWLPFLLIVMGGITWNVLCVMFLARRVLPDAWFERAIAEMGQSMGVTATGLLLLRAVDPENETAAPSAFGYKQLLHEPIMGGGLWTSMAIPLVMIHGGMPVFILSAGVIAAWLLVLRQLRKRA